MDKKWYVVNTYSGHENKVKEKLEMRTVSMGMEDYIFRVIVPEEKVIEEIINNQLNELKNNKDIDIRKVFKQVDDITDYFIKYYDDDSDIVSECDQIADDLLFKAIGRNERTLELPVSSSYIKNYCLSSNISNNQLFDSLVWIALRLVAINYCIRFNSSLEDNNED